MKEILKWLRDVEHLASEAYLQGVSSTKNDHEFREFLKSSAEDEAWHYHVIGSASEFLSSIPDITPAVSIDKHTSDKIFKYLNEIKVGFEQQTLGKDELIEKIVRVELSEWNDIFLYVVNLLTEKTSEFKYPAARIQAHLNGIEKFVSQSEGNSQLLDKIKEVPPVWVENILIVDDEKPIAKLIESLLNRSGNIDIAHNGVDALKMMEATFYKLIISDVDMPLMDGISFYKKAVQKFPTSCGRFLFITGDFSPQRQEFFTNYQIPAFKKPLDILLLREESQKIILSKSN